MTLAVTYHVGSDTPMRVVPGTHRHDGRAVIFVVSEGLTILADCWEDLQRLVLVLHDAIAEARQAEDRAVGDRAVGDRATGASDPTASTPARAPMHGIDGRGGVRVCAIPGGAAFPSEQQVQAAEAELMEAGGVRVLVQRDARAQLRAEGLPVSRATVTLRAAELLRARTTPAALP